MSFGFGILKVYIFIFSFFLFESVFFKPSSFMWVCSHACGTDCRGEKMFQNFIKLYLLRQCSTSIFFFFFLALLPCCASSFFKTSCSASCDHSWVDAFDMLILSCWLVRNVWVNDVSPVVVSYWHKLGLN